MLPIIHLKLFIGQPQQNNAFSKMRSCKIIYLSGQLSNKAHEVFSSDTRRQPKLWKYSAPELNFFESLVQSQRLQWKLTLDTHAKHYPLQEQRACATENSWHLQSKWNLSRKQALYRPSGILNFISKAECAPFASFPEQDWQIGKCSGWPAVSKLRETENKQKPYLHFKLFF